MKMRQTFRGHFDVSSGSVLGNIVANRIPVEPAGLFPGLFLLMECNQPPNILLFRVRRRYEGLLFDRDVQGRSAAERVIGVGHKVFDKAIRDASELPVSLAYVQDLSRSLVVFQIFDRVTDQLGHMRQSVVGIEIDWKDDQRVSELIRDWKVLKRLNLCKIKEKTPEYPDFTTNEIASMVEQAAMLLKEEIESLGLPFRIPEYRPVALLLSDNVPG